MALPAILSGGLKLLSGGSRLARTANVGRKLLGIKGKKNKETRVEDNEPSAIIVRPSTSLIPESVSVSSGQSTTETQSNPATGKSTLEEDVEYIKNKTLEIDKLLKSSFAQQKKDAANLRKLRANARRSKKEEGYEKGGSSGILGKAKEKVKAPFSNIFEGIKNYLTSIVLGFIAVRLIPLLPKLIELAKFIAPVVNFITDFAGVILNGLVTFIDWGFKAYDATRGFIEAIGGEDAAKVFDKFSGVLTTFLNLAFIAAMISAKSSPDFGRKRCKCPKMGRKKRKKPGSGRPKVTKTGGKPVGRPDIRNPLRERPKVTTTGGGTSGKPDIRNPLRKKPKITGTTGTGIFSGIGDFFGGAVDDAKKLAGGAVDNAKKLAGGAVDNAKKLAGGAVDNAKKFTEGITEVGKGVAKRVGGLAEGASKVYKDTVGKLSEVADGLVKKGKDAVFTWLQKQPGVLGKVGKAAPGLFKKLPFVGDIVGFVFDIVGGVDWRRALIRAVAGATVDAGFTALVSALGIATPFTGGASGLLAAAVYAAYMAADVASGGFGKVLGDKIADFFKIPVKAGEKGGDSPEPKAVGTESDIKKAQAELSKKAKEDPEFAKKISPVSKKVPEVKDPLKVSEQNNVEVPPKSDESSEVEVEKKEVEVEKKEVEVEKKEVEVEKKEKGGTVGLTAEEKEKKLKSDKIIPTIKSPELSVKDVGATLRGSGNTGEKVKSLYKPAGIIALTKLGNKLREVPIVGESMATAVRIALGIKPDSRTFNTIGANLINFATLDNIDGIASSPGELAQVVTKMETGGEVDFISDVESLDNSAKAINMGNFLKTELQRLDLTAVDEEEEKKQESIFDKLFGLFKPKKDPNKEDDETPDAPGASGSSLDLGSTEYGEGPLIKTATQEGIKDKELAAFLAQMAHETGNFKYRREIGGGKSHYSGGGPWTDSSGKTYTAKYHGRGYVQLTHDYNYEKYGKRLGIDLLENPDLAMQGDVAARIAVMYWKDGVRPMVKGDWDNVFLHSAAVNNPSAKSSSDINGYDDRVAKYNKYVKQIGSGELAKKVETSMSAPKPSPPGVSPSPSSSKPSGKKVSVGGGNIVEIGKDLISQGYAVSEHPDFTKQKPSGSYTPGSGYVSNVHGGRGHYEGRAIDVTDWRGSLADSQARYRKVLDSLSGNPSIKMLIHDTWGFQDTTGKSGPGGHGHPEHMHIETKQGGGLIQKNENNISRSLQTKMSYDKKSTRVLIQPVITERTITKTKPIPMMSGSSSSGGGVNNTSDRLFAG